MDTQEVHAHDIATYGRGKYFAEEPANEIVDKKISEANCDAT
jgi:hypothetical protein